MFVPETVSLTQLLKWLCSKLTDAKRVPDNELKQCIPIIYKLITDRSADVRKAAEDSIGPWTKHARFISGMSRWVDNE